jgi:serine/threonine protein kinase
VISLVIIALMSRSRGTHHRFFSGGEEKGLEGGGNSTGEDQILFKNVVMEDLIGRGTFTLLHRAHEGYRQFAIKTLKDNYSELGRAELITEIERYKLIQMRDPSGHPNIIRYYGGSRDTTPLFMCIELMKGGTLQSLLAGLKLGPIPDWYIEFASQTIEDTYVDYVAGSLMYIILQVSRGMAFLGHYGITHRSLSVRNVFLTHDLQAKIGNFGVPLEGNYYLVTEREKYVEDIAPENMQGIHFSIKSDIWSFGILVYKICTLGSDPFPGINPNDIYHEIGAGRRPNVLKCCDNNLYFLLQRCWQHSPSDRPFFPSLQSHFEGMIDEPSNHILLELNENENEPGYLDDRGVAHLFRPPVHLLDGTAQRNARRTPLLHEWKMNKKEEGSSDKLKEHIDGPMLDKRPTPLGKDREKSRKGRSVVRQLPTLEVAKASIAGKTMYLPPLEESRLLEEDELEDLDIADFARGVPMPLTHAGSNLSVYSEEASQDSS